MIIKVCGISSEPNYNAIAKLNVDMIGLNFYPHSKRYIEYILSIKTKEESKKVDGQAFSTAPDIPASMIAQIYEEFPQKFRDYLVKSLSDQELQEEAQASAPDTIKRAIVKSIKQSNKEGKDPSSDPMVIATYKDAKPISEDLFENPIAEDDFNYYSTDESNPRTSLAIAKLSEALELDMETLRKCFDEQEETAYKLNKEQLKKVISQRNFHKTLDGLTKLFESESFPLSPETNRRVPEGDPLAVRIFREDIKQEIEGCLSSNDPEQIAWAIDILHMLSTKVKINAPLHFIAVINHGLIYRNLISLPGKNPPILPATYLEKITDPESGIIIRKQEYEEQFTVYNALLESDICTPQDKLAAIMTASTELALSNIQYLHKAGELKTALTKKPNKEEYSWIGIFDNMSYEDVLSHLILRSDGPQLLESILQYRDEIPQEFLDTLLLISSKHSFANKITIQLIDLGANIYQQDKYGYTILHLAAQDSNTEVVEKLIAVGADINQPGKEGLTPLFIAAKNGHTDIVGKLIAADDINVNQPDNVGYNPLLIASENGYTEIVAQLIEGDVVIIDQSDKWGGTPLLAATQFGRTEIVKKLIKVGASVHKTDEVDGYGHSPLCIASIEGHSDIAKILIAAGASANQQSKSGYTPLYMASLWGHTEIVKELIRAKASVNQWGRDDFTSLFVASKKGHTEIVKELIGAKASVNRPNKHGFTPLYAASEKGRTDTVKELLNAGAIMSMHRFGYPKTSKPHKVAAHFHHPDLATLIKQVHIEQKELKRVLNHKPAKSGIGGRSIGPTISVKNYLDQCLNKDDLPILLNSQNKYGKNALYHAAEAGWNIDDIKTLVASGANPNIVTQCNQKSFTEHALDKGMYNVLEILMTQDDEIGITPEIIKGALNGEGIGGKGLFKKALENRDPKAIEIFAIADARYNDGKLYAEIKPASRQNRSDNASIPRAFEPTSVTPSTSPSTEDHQQLSRHSPRHLEPQGEILC